MCHVNPNVSGCCKRVAQRELQLLRCGCSISSRRQRARGPGAQEAEMGHSLALWHSSVPFRFGRSFNFPEINSEVARLFQFS